jgi:competence protein ComEC
VSAAYFYFPVLSFLIGIAIASIVSCPLPTALFVFLVGCSLLVTASLFRLSVQSRYICLIGLVVCFLGVGLFRMEYKEHSFGTSPLQASLNTPVTLSGVVTKEPEERATQTLLYVMVGDDTLLVQGDRFTKVSYGDAVIVSGILSLPETFTTDLGREFNYPLYLKARGVEYRIAPAEVTIVSSGHGSLGIASLLEAKAQLVTGIERVIEAPQSGLGLGLLLGIKQALGEDLERAFRASGLTHIVVLSGYNVMLIVTFTLFCLSFFFGRKMRSIIGIIAIILFALLVGLSATVVRASIMAALLLVAQFLGRNYALLRGLLLAAALMVAVNPYLLLFDIGFQFSFMATLGLIFVAPRLESSMIEGSVAPSLKDFFIATIATQIAVLPLLIYYIGEVSLVSVVVNVLVLPVVPVEMALTAVAGVIAILFPQIALPVAFIAQVVLTYIMLVAHYFSALPLATITVPSISAWMVGVLYISIVMSLYFFKRTRLLATVDTTWVIEEEIEIASKTKIASPASASPKP